VKQKLHEHHGVDTETDT